MKYCKKCTMPDTRPGMVFDENGICYPCLNIEKRKAGQRVLKTPIWEQ